MEAVQLAAALIGCLTGVAALVALPWAAAKFVQQMRSLLTAFEKLEAREERQDVILVQHGELIAGLASDVKSLARMIEMLERRFRTP